MRKFMRHFLKVRRNLNGCYVVNIPFTEDMHELGDSRGVAEK